MTELTPDPHVHAEAGTGGGVAHRRSAIASAVGRAPSVPTTVTTGCGERRPLAATSRTPERVTCLACREHARQAHETWAAALESTVTAVVAFDPDLAARAGTEARRHRDLAARYRT